MTPSIEEALRSGAVRGEANEGLTRLTQQLYIGLGASGRYFTHQECQAFCEALVALIEERDRLKRELDSVCEKAVEKTLALDAAEAERDRLKVERDRAVAAFAEGNYLDAHKRVPDVYQHALALTVEQFRKAEARALAAEAECDALREALAAEREACAVIAWQFATKAVPPDGPRVAARLICDAIRARALTQEQLNGE